ncbi:Putative uncharacterized protein [Moritella viscosa]|nr:Putative uncharacterized protein [Moritella viscosa]
MKHVNTTLYWQISLGDDDWSEDQLVRHTRKVLKQKLKEVFVVDANLADTTVTVFCMVGNLRAFAFKIS